MVMEDLNLAGAQETNNADFAAQMAEASSGGDEVVSAEDIESLAQQYDTSGDPSTGGGSGEVAEVFRTQEQFDAALTKRFAERDEKWNERLGAEQAEKQALLERLARFEGQMTAQQQQRAQAQAPQEQAFEMPGFDGMELTPESQAFVDRNDQRFEAKLAHEKQVLRQEMMQTLKQAIEPLKGGFAELQNQRAFNTYNDAMTQGQTRHPWMSDPSVNGLVKDHLVAKLSGVPNVTPELLAQTIDGFAKTHGTRFAAPVRTAPAGIPMGRGGNRPVAPDTFPKTMDDLGDFLQDVGQQYDNRQASLTAWRNKG